MAAYDQEPANDSWVSSPTPMTEEALGHLLQEHLPKVHRALWRLTSDEQLAWDCTNQAAIRLINENRKKSELTKPITWLMVVARRIALDHFKSAYSRHESTVGAHADDFPAVGTTPWSPRTHSDLVAEVKFNDFLQRIRTQIGNKHDAQIWEMRAIWKFPGREVAEALGISEATVSRRYRAACEKATGDPWNPKATPLDLTRLVLVSGARKATPSAPPGRATSHPNKRTTQKVKSKQIKSSQTTRRETKEAGEYMRVSNELPPLGGTSYAEGTSWPDFYRQLARQADQLGSALGEIVGDVCMWDVPWSETVVQDKQ